jgi:hypothetical protein
MSFAVHAFIRNQSLFVEIRRMKRFFSAMMAASVLAFGGMLMAGCEVEGVGDPCTPENIPTNGFQESEASIETSSVQCRTRICLVNKLQGDPSCIRDECPDSDPSCALRCASRDAIENSVYCTCRCDGPPGTAEFCACPEGFVCQEIISSETAGAGIQGSYCVKPKLGE